MLTCRSLCPCVLRIQQSPCLERQGCHYSRGCLTAGSQCCLTQMGSGVPPLSWVSDWVSLPHCTSYKVTARAPHVTSPESSHLSNHWQLWGLTFSEHRGPTRLSRRVSRDPESSKPLGVHPATCQAIASSPVSFCAREGTVRRKQMIPQTPGWKWNPCAPSRAWKNWLCHGSCGLCSCEASLHVSSAWLGDKAFPACYTNNLSILF